MAEPAFDAIGPALHWFEQGRAVAFATVTRTWGSSPRPVGSQMAVRDDGAFAGSVSGGCVEGAVVGEAKASLADGNIRNLRFGVTNEDAWAVGLACGGTIEIHVTPFPTPDARDVLKALRHAQDAHRPAVLASDLASGETRLLFPDTAESGALPDAARDAAARDQSGLADIAGKTWFLAVFNPPVDLAIVGAVHIAQPLAAMARLADFSVRIVDPRAQFATPERFADSAIFAEWPDDVFSRSPLGSRSALVALTHDPKIDDVALSAALKSPAFYIGALGSRATHQRRLERLGAQGFSTRDLERIRGPVGLDIGARSPAEIAISVLAEITQTLRSAEKKTTGRPE